MQIKGDFLKILMLLHACSSIWCTPDNVLLALAAAASTHDHAWYSNK
jgi:hypothetical protein